MQWNYWDSLFSLPFHEIPRYLRGFREVVRIPEKMQKKLSPRATGLRKSAKTFENLSKHIQPSGALVGPCGPLVFVCAPCCSEHVDPCGAPVDPCGLRGHGWRNGSQFNWKNWKPS